MTLTKSKTVGALAGKGVRPHHSKLIFFVINLEEKNSDSLSLVRLAAYRH